MYEDARQDFEDFMAVQVAVMLASGEDPAEWIERHAAHFRDEWEAIAEGRAMPIPKH